MLFNILVIDIVPQIENVKHMRSDPQIIYLGFPSPQPENVLLLSKNRQHIKLIDFGLSRVITDAEEVRDLVGEFILPSHYICFITNHLDTSALNSVVTELCVISSKIK